MPEKVNILGIQIENFSLSEVLDRVDEIVELRSPEYYACINLNQIVLYKENERFRQITDNAGLLTVDGQPVMWIAKLLNTPIKTKIPGIEFVKASCKMAAEKGYSVFFLGGAPGSAEKAVDHLRKDTPKLRVAGTYSPPFGFEKNPAEMQKINNLLRNSNADLLFVGLGSPKADVFIDENKDIYQIPLSCSIGIVIDYLAGKIKKAPKWMSDAGLEWFYRFCQEPRRLFKRYFIDSWKIVGYIIRFKRKGSSG